MLKKKLFTLDESIRTYKTKSPKGKTISYVEFPCSNCQNTWKCHPSRLKYRKFSGLCRKCIQRYATRQSATRPKYSKIYYKNCAQCGKVFISRTPNKKLCGSKCKKIWISKYNIQYREDWEKKYVRLKSDCNSSKNKNTKRTLQLTKEQYYNVIKDNTCYYCSGTLGNKGYSLDRIDNNLGYEVNNILPCCKNCNRFRMDLLTVDETLHLIKILKQLRRGRVW
jgi:hypothetical protein